MAWTESPGYFWAATETGRDIMQTLIDGAPGYPHMFPKAVVRRQSSPVADRPWQISAVYVNNYILAAVESPDGSAQTTPAMAAAARTPYP